MHLDFFPKLHPFTAALPLHLHLVCTCPIVDTNLLIFLFLRRYRDPKQKVRIHSARRNYSSLALIHISDDFSVTANLGHLNLPMVFFHSHWQQSGDVTKLPKSHGLEYFHHPTQRDEIKHIGFLTSAIMTRGTSELLTSIIYSTAALWMFVVKLPLLAAIWCYF